MADTAVVGTPETHGQFVPSFASYNWIGPPAGFGLTTNVATGGDSNSENINKWFQSGDQAYIIIASAMVSSRNTHEQANWGLMRLSGLGDGTGSRFPLFWSCTQKVRSVVNVGLHDCWISDHLPMVLLGLFSRIL